MSLDWLWVWLGLGGASIGGLLALAWFFPPLRKYALLAAGVLATLLAAYSKGSRDRAALERKRRDQAVDKARSAYDKIDTRPDDDRTVDERLRRGRF
jgi:hypothetical protein